MTLATKLIAGYAALTSATTAFAHQGNGLGGIHWHATDAAVFIALALVAGLALWWGGHE